MNILPKKSWHVKNKKNIERVQKDEAEAERLDKLEKERKSKADQEARIRELRNRAGLNLSEDGKHFSLFEGQNQSRIKDDPRQSEEKKRVRESKWDIVSSSKSVTGTNRAESPLIQASSSNSTPESKRLKTFDKLDVPYSSSSKESKMRIQKSDVLVTEGCRSSNLYEKLEKIGEGTYGAVFKARCKETNQLMALKKLKLESEKEGFPITSIRETLTLLKGKHPHVIDVREIVFGDRLDQIYIVMEYMDRDLKSLMEDMKRPFKIAEVKLLMQQLISAVTHLHNNWIIHRDLKTSNLLINKGILKVGDFGLAREYGSPLKQYTNKVVTLWYRAPELLLQTGKYSTPIDVWSIGCIFGELLIQKPLFPGQSETQQLELIFRTLGSPNEGLWPDYEKIRLVQRIRFPIHKYNKLPERLSDKKALSEKGFHFWNKLLAYDPGVKTKVSVSSDLVISKPTHRITAEAASKHEFFDEEPRPIHPSLFPTWPSKRHTNL